ncbi:MAG: restriction endonuclease subunit S [Deltaproteobacteria bacterium]|nr:restriction endonuclease subunit S [Deltaproteobacteria bacterium]
MNAARWRVASLEEVCEPPQYGYTASAEDKGNVRFLRITDITESGVKWPAVPFCECPSDLLPKYQLASGDIVFARIGATTGKSYLITNPPSSVFASYLIRVRCKSEIDPAFLSMFFRSNDYWRQVDAQKDTNLKKGVNGSILKTLRVPLPPLPEQRKIAGVLGVVQRAMEQQERLLALTAELKKALLHQLFTAGLRGEPQKETEIGLVPESWEVKRLEEVALIIMGQSPDGDSYNVDGTGVPLINGPVEFGPNPLSKTLEAKFTTRPTKCCEQGDLILCVRGSTTGRTNIAKGRACIGRGVAAIRATGNQEYLNQFVASIRGRIYAMGTGTTFPNVSGSQIREILVAVPPLKVQSEIGSILASIDHKHELLERKHASLTALFRTLLHQLMTAELRVRDLDPPLLSDSTE